MNNKKKDILLDKLIGLDDPLDDYMKNELIFMFFINIIIMLTIILMIYEPMLSLAVMFATITILSYVRSKKKMDMVAGKLFIDSVTYLDDISLTGTTAITGYMPVENVSIGVKDDSLFTYLVTDENGEETFYITKEPLNEEIYTAMKIPTKFGAADVIGMQITDRLIDVVFDPQTGKRIPIKQIIMSPKMASMDIIQLEESAIQKAVILPITEPIETTLDVSAKKLTSWAITCNQCGGKLDPNKIEESQIGVYITCDYCGTNNGIRTVKDKKN